MTGLNEVQAIEVEAIEDNRSDAEKDPQRWAMDFAKAASGFTYEAVQDIMTNWEENKDALISQFGEPTELSNLVAPHATLQSMLSEAKESTDAMAKYAVVGLTEELSKLESTIASLRGTDPSVLAFNISVGLPLSQLIPIAIVRKANKGKRKASKLDDDVVTFKWSKGIDREQDGVLLSYPPTGAIAVREGHPKLPAGMSIGKDYYAIFTDQGSHIGFAPGDISRGQLYGIMACHAVGRPVEDAGLFSATGLGATSFDGQNKSAMALLNNMPTLTISAINKGTNTEASNKPVGKRNGS